MYTPENRLYAIQGELMPSQWDDVIHKLGSYGITTEMISSALVMSSDSEHSSALETMKDTFVSRTDFNQFAKENEFSDVIATKAWHTLGKLYASKHDVLTSYKTPYWYYARDFESVALVYDIVPRTPDGKTVLYPQLDCLQLHSLSLFIDNVESMIEKHSPTVIKKLYAGLITQKVYSFLHDFERQQVLSVMKKYH
ncbi:MAG: hypothetical protein NVSMB46_09490 [Candidatus Saccharimonadales bacterium]